MHLTAYGRLSYRRKLCTIGCLINQNFFKLYVASKNQVGEKILNGQENQPGKWNLQQARNDEKLYAMSDGNGYQERQSWLVWIYITEYIQLGNATNIKITLQAKHSC